MRLDHVVYGVTDLAEAAARLETEHGLRFIPGGRHPGGTVNSVAPLAPPQLRAVAIASPGGEVVLSDRSATGWPAL